MSHRATKLLALSLLAVLGVVVLATVGFVGGAAAANGSQVDVDVTSLEGDGSEANPYVITNASELQAINDDLEANYTLGNDVNASGTADWNSGEGFDPIGNCPNSFSALHDVCSGTSFNGTFDGNGHTISDLYVDRPNGTGVGLFALAKRNATFENVRMENVTVRGDENVGGLVGQLETGTIQNVSVAGDVDGGIVSSVEPDGGKIGGIVGIAGNAQVDHQVVFRGNVTGGYNVGGLVGRMRFGTVVVNSYARANVTANSARGDGDNDEAGGIAGNSGTSSEFENLYFAGSVEADGSAGAIVGNSTDDGADDFTDVYWNENATSQGSGGNVSSTTNFTSLTTSEMQGSTASSNMNLDFGDSWVLVDGEYPVLQWEAAGAEIVDVTAANVTAVEDELAQITVNATDEFGKAADGENVTIAANDDGLEGISVGGPVTTNASGQATFAFTEPNAGQYAIEITAANGSLSNTTTVTVEDVVAPAFSEGRSNTGTINESTTGVVLDVDADDNDGTDWDANVTYSLGGVDAAPFNIDSENGRLSLDSAQDFENPADNDENNDYELAVTATDEAGNASQQNVTVEVTDVNEPPSVDTNAGLTVDEGSNATEIDGSVLASSDPEQSAESITYDVTSAVSNGTLFVDGSGDGTDDSTLDGESPIGTGTFTQAAVDSGNLRYSHDGSETTSDAFEFDVTDGNGSTVTGYSFDITVDPVNDAPIMSTDDRNLTAIDEDAEDPNGNDVSSVLDSAGTTGDADADTLGIAVVGVDDTNGTWQYSTDGSSWQNVSDAANDSALLLAEDDSLRFVPDDNYSGTTGSVTIRAWDQHAGTAGNTSANASASGGTSAYSASIASVDVTVADAPEVDSIDRLSPSSPTNAPSVDFTVTFSESVSDVSTDDFTVTQATGTVSGTVAEVTGSGDSYTVTVDSVTDDGDLRLDLIDDDGITNSAGVALGGSGTNGAGNGSYVAGQVFSIDNSAPQLNDDAGTTDEDTSATIVDDLTSNDTDEHSLNVTAVEGSADNLGTQTTGSNGGLFTVTNGGQVNFDPNGTFESLGADDSATSQINVTVTDAVGNDATQTVTATIQGVNDAPTMSSDDRTVTEIDEDADSNGGTLIGDVLNSAGTTNDTEGDVLGVAVIGVDDTDGTWEHSADDGNAWQPIDGTSPADDSALLLAEDDLVRFVPNANFSGDADGSVTFRAWDGTNGSANDSDVDTTANGGNTSFSTNTSSASITVADAPEVTSIERSNPSSPTNASNVEFVVTFSEVVTGVDDSDFATAGNATGSISQVSGSGTTRNVTATVSDDGVLRLDLIDDDTITNGAGVALGGNGTGGAGNGSFVDGQTFSIDTTAPSVNITSPSDGYYSSQQVINGTASDEGAGIATVELQIENDDGHFWNGSSFTTSETWVTATGNTTWSYNTSDIDADGNYTVTARAIDEVNNTNTVSVNYTVDTIPPTISEFNVTNPSDQTVKIEFQSNETLEVIDVTIGGAESANLTRDDFETTTNDTYTATYSGSSDGAYNVTLLTATDLAGNDGANNQAGNVTIDTSSDSPPDDDDSDQSDDDDTDETPESVVVESSQNTTTVTVTAIDGLRTIGIENLTTTIDSVDENNIDPNTGPKNVTLESLTVSVEDVPDGSLNVTARELQRDGPVSTTTALTAERRGFTNETGAVPIGEVTVEHTISDDRISNATFGFSVRKSYLESRDVAPEDVDLFRNESRGWNAVSTSLASENSTHYHFRAESPGFSRFVVGTSRPVFDVASVSLDTDVLERGESATVTASIENVGNVTGSRDVDLVVDGEHEATTSVLVEARSTEAVSFDVSPSTAGTYQLMIGDQNTTLAVERASQPDPPGDEESESTDDGLPWIGILIVILAGILLTVLFLVRRRDLDVFDSRG